MFFAYLKEEQYYIDLYDLSTIKQCFEIIQMFQDIYDKSLTNKEIKHIPKREKYKGVNVLMYWQLSTTQASRYKEKKETVQKWMDDDRFKQEQYDNAREPENVYCLKCKSVMKVRPTKELEDFMDMPLRVMFLFRCTNKKCKKQEWIYENGEIRESKPFLCPKCKKEAQMTHNKKGKVITWTTKCSSCGFSEASIDDFGKMKKEREQREQEEKELLKFREAFCLSDKEGQKYMDSLDSMEFAPQVYEEEKRKYDNTAYQQVSQVKKLGIVELEKIISERLEKEKYIKFSFDRPEMGQFVILGFVVQDADTSRRENISISTLQKIIKESLEGTNWRLMSDGIHYRLGFVYGKIKGFERKEDLLQLYGKKKETKLSEEYEEKKRKYGHSTWVVLAGLRGKQEGIDNTRKERLKKEPEGFFLEVDGYYNCSICYQGHYGNEIWWNLDGMRCSDCWRNIKEGVLPSLKNHLFDNKDEWISRSQLKDKHNIQPASVKKLRREGLLHGRYLKRADGSIYETIYLISENKKFLKKYPRVKEKEDPNILTLDIEGHVAQLGTFAAEEECYNTIMQKTSFKFGNLKLDTAIFSLSTKQDKMPAILFVHGWTSEKERSYQYAEALTKLGFICFLFDMRGHGKSEGDIKAFTIKEFLDDVLAAYDYLVNVDGVDKDNISAVGSSFGSYLIALLSEKRNVTNLSMRVPADYPNEEFEHSKYKASGSDNPQIVSWRSKAKKQDETYALRALHKFDGNIQIIESEKDTVVPHQTIQNYIDAVADKNKLTHVVMKDAPHSIKEEAFRDEVEKVLKEWFKKRRDDIS